MTTHIYKADSEHYSLIREYRVKHRDNAENKRTDIFKSQDLENGHFDVAFEIEGKKLYAHKYILTTVSETMAAMLSTRWSEKDEVIKIEAYSYDNFYEFLCFLYSGDCKLSNENIFQLVDMAEFYGVQCLKRICDLFLSVMEHKICKWVQHQNMQQKDAGDENFNLREAVETEFDNIFPLIAFSHMSFDFLMNFVVEKGFFLSPSQLSKYFSRLHQPTNEINLLKDVYELAKKQALQKQKLYPNDNFDLVACVRTDLAQIIPQIKFYEMDEVFLNDFVVANGILTEEEASRVSYTKVTISNDGNTITGAFKDDFGIPNAIFKIRGKHYDTKQASNKKLRFTKLLFGIPSVPSSVQKMKGVDWYFCLESDGVLTFKHSRTSVTETFQSHYLNCLGDASTGYSLVGRSDYLLAEMKSGTEFKLNPENWSRLFASINNV